MSLSVQHSIALSFRKFVERRHVGAMVLGSRGRGAGWGSLRSAAQAVGQGSRGGELVGKLGQLFARGLHLFTYRWVSVGVATSDGHFGGHWRSVRRSIPSAPVPLTVRTYAQ